MSIKSKKGRKLEDNEHKVLNGPQEYLTSSLSRPTTQRKAFGDVNLKRFSASKITLLVIFFATLLNASLAKKKDPKEDDIEACTAIGEDYRGNVSKTKSGKKCIDWSKFYITTYKDNGIGEHNYCRNPTAEITGPYCVVKNNGRYEDDVEPCDVECEPGFLAEYYEHSCTIVSGKLEGNKSLEMCSNECAERDDCMRFDYVPGANCNICDPSSPIEHHSGARVMRYYDISDLQKCALSEEHRNAKDLYTLKCPAISKAPECLVRCNDDYEGEVNIECKKGNKFFTVDSNCEPTCIVPTEEFSQLGISLINCRSNHNPSKLTASNCNLSCEENYIGEVSAHCKKAGSKFTVIGTCRLKKCMMVSQLSFPGIDFENCNHTEDSLVSTTECALQCKQGFSGNPSAVCNNDQEMLTILGNCERFRSSLPPNPINDKDDKNETKK